MKILTAKLSVLLVLVSSVTFLGQQAHGYQPYQAPQGQYRPYQAPQGQYRPYQAPQGQYQQYQAPQGQYQPYWSPYQQPQQQRQQRQQQYFKPPRIETSISDSTPYEQQSLVYTLRIISSGNLKTATPELPQITSVVLRQLGDSVTRSSKVGGEQEMITEYRYLLMPFSSGVIQIPPASVTGTYAAAGGASGPFFDVEARQSVILKVRPAVESVQPWLPLYDLQIDAKIRGSEMPAAGNPVTLEVETKAVGATGSQIPSIASQFSSDEFRIYPGKSVAEGSISPDGRTLRGRRVETFTLVPQYGGWLKIPAVNINWWNVRYNRPEVASLLMHQLNVAGPANPNRGGRESGDASPASSFFYWVPLVAAIAMLMYGWISAFLGTGRLPGLSRLSKLGKPVLGKLYAPIVSLVVRVSPRRRFHRLRTWTGRQLPVSWQLWFCLRAVAREGDPGEWAQALQILAVKHLGVRPQANLKHLGKSIVACHPRANAQQVDRLMGQLDEAVYGGTPIESFERWKHEFKSQIKPGLFPIRFRQCRAVAAGHPSRVLPQLNPQ
ncbi:MAG: BatD family protein [Pseudomonadota bacterium]|nr:BatD family protein [Pseudomonadota bacterium]